MGGRQVDEKIMGNLEQMKLVMGRKVATNDYIYEQFGEESGVHALIDRIGRLADSLTQEHQATNALIRQRYVLLQTTPTPTLKAPTPKPLDLASVSAYFHAVQTTLGQLDADPHPALLQQSHRLSALLDSRLSALQPRR